MKYKVESVWTSGEPYEISINGKNIKLQSYFLEVVNEDGAKKVFINQKPETPAPQQGDMLDLEISDKMNKKETHYKAKKKSDLPPLKCPCGCGFEGPLSEFKPDSQRASVSPANSQTSQSTTPTPNTSQGASQGTNTASQDEPPVENYNDIPF